MKSVSEGTVVSGKELADILKVSQRRVQQMAKKEIIPKAKRGQYPLIGSVRGYIGYLQELAQGQQRDTLDGKAERARLLKAQADKTELEVAALEGALVSTEVVDKVWTRMLTACRARILAAPHTLAAQVITIHEYGEAEQLIRTVLHEALSELAEYDCEHYGQDAPAEERSDD